MLNKLIPAIEACWDEQTSQAGEGVWSPDNPARGQCAVSSLVVQDYLGGKLVRGIVSDDYMLKCVHYWNELPNGMWLDTTQAQFVGTTQISDISYRTTLYVLSNESARERYEILSRRVTRLLKGLDTSAGN